MKQLINFVKKNEATHYLFPSVHNARFLMPKKLNIACRGLCFFAANCQKIKMLCLHFLSFFSPIGWVSFTPQVIEVLGLNEAQLSRTVVSLGTSGPYQKQTIVQFDEQLRPESVYKIAFSKSVKKLLCNEAFVLRFLHKKLIDKIPTVINFKSKSQIRFLQQSIKKKQKCVMLSLNDEVINFLTSLHTATSVECALKDTLIYKKIINRRLKLHSLLSVEWQERYMKCITYFEKHVNHIGYYVCAHRDFVKWNMLISRNNQLFVYDWEYSELRYPPTYDLFHFLLMPKAVKGIAKNQDMHDAIAMVSVLSMYSQLPVHIDMCLYLLDICSFYIDSTNGDTDYSVVVKNYAKLIDNIFLWDEYQNEY